MTRGEEAAAPLRIGDEIDALLTPPAPDPFPSLADALYARLWKRIVNLEFPPGTRLSEEALAKELGVSRTPVREALLRLGQVGLLRLSARRGVSVPTIARVDVVELYDLRAALEGYAARRATPILSGEEIAAQRARQGRGDGGAASRSPAAAEEFFRADLSLHELLHQRGGNHRGARLLKDVMGQLGLLSLRAAHSPASRRAAIAEHSRILDALDRRDPAAAAEAMESHIEAVKGRALADVDAGLLPLPDGV